MASETALTLEDRRKHIHTVLAEICPTVYYEPPTGQQIKYPCIIYRRGNLNKKRANDKVYGYRVQYELTLITKNPEENDMFEQLLNLDYCSFDRHYTADNLYHDSFSLYF